MDANDRFWKRVAKTDFCWLWTGAKTGFGYGQLTRNKKHDVAHRVSWEIAFGEIPEGMCVLHKCDVPCCVNPDHLWLGTYGQNNADMRMKGRHSKGESHYAAILTEKQVIEMRKLKKSGARTTDIAKVFGITLRHASLILTGKRWACVKG